jgi:hypothetical protein
MLGGESRVDYHVPLGLGGGTCEVCRADADVEVVGLGLQPVGGALVAAAPDGRRHVEEDREVGKQSFRGEPRQLGNGFRAAIDESTYRSVITTAPRSTAGRTTDATCSARSAA